MPQLDLIDKQILGMLVADCRTPYREIAKVLGMSATAINRGVGFIVTTLFSLYCICVKTIWG
ncbi:AsnC family protein [Candidatus Thorarchaeota archaeon]|nr:MAG: AsnC family protein [Candidatus Thorarchaeota archaeon]